MGNKLYVTQVPTPDFKIMHPDNTVIWSEDFSCSYETAQEAAKAAKAPVKEKK
jgi:large subunit ribosomal protein L25